MLAKGHATIMRTNVPMACHFCTSCASRECARVRACACACVCWDFVHMPLAHMCVQAAAAAAAVALAGATSAEAGPAAETGHAQFGEATTQVGRQPLGCQIEYARACTIAAANISHVSICASMAEGRGMWRARSN